MQPIKSFIGVGLLLAAVSSANAATDSSGVWTSCATEGGVCKITGTQAVRYGASSKFSAGTFKTSVKCTNAVFGDPIPGTTKACEVLSPTLAPTNYAWKQIASEGATATFSGIKAVRYGASGQYYSGSFNGTVTCNNTKFRGDPISGVVKTCEVLAAATTTAATTTAATTTAATTTAATTTTTAATTTAATTATTSATSSSTTTTTASTWTKCGGPYMNAVGTTGNYGYCKFTGVREGRYTSDGVTYYSIGKYNKSIKCNIYDLGLVNVTTAQDSLNAWCEIGSQISELPFIAKPTIKSIPADNPGSSSALTTPETRTLAYQGPQSGEFREACDYSHFNYDDPIKSPNVKNGAAGLMSYFGNSGIDFSTNAMYLSSTGSSTCYGGILNRSGYYMPAMIDTKDGSALSPSVIVVYYKTGYIVDSVKITTPPTGLVVLVDADPVVVGLKDRHFHYACHTNPNDLSTLTTSETIPTNCVAGLGELTISFDFPQCWDGVNLDSTDHKSHMAYASTDFGGCPATHPVALPRVGENIHYTVKTAGDTANWRLSTDGYTTSVPGGLTAFAGWMFGWDTTTINTVVKGCLNTTFDCGSNWLPNKALDSPPAPANGARGY